ncbi:MAG: gliding motility-associated C-terminal domain-containing protein [Saprospirales bacterium]|nr:gliding motility-associated C-terminal domain-containing protein [Saprospirales bacterium]
MLKSTLLLAFCCAIASLLSAQTFNISYKNPDQLVVCAADTLSVTILNNTAAPVNDAFLDLELPPGLEYLPGSVAGASEFDIANLEKPVLALPALPPNTPLTVQLRLAATCGLVAAINSAQLFNLVLRVRAGAATEQVATTKFQIQTGLLVITQVDNDSIYGEKGQMLMRTLHVRNTRLGAVQHLFLTDSHPAGISIQVAGAAAQQDLPAHYSAYFDGAFFTAFGDGDNLLEFGETALIKQQITVTDCGFPGFTCRSNLAAAWSCTAAAAPCQADSTYADVVVLPSSYQPKLSFLTQYALPWEICAETPHKMRLRMINEGPGPATNLILQINSEAPTALGMDKNSFQIHQNGASSPLIPNLAEDFVMPVCNDTNSAFITLYIPEMQGFDTLEITFNTYYCLPACTQFLPKIRLNYYYNKPCPPGGFIVADTVVFEPKPGDYLNAAVAYNIGECLEDNQTYPFQYRLNSNRLLSDSGYVWLKFDLPVGLEWSPDCPLLLDGKMPVLFSDDTMTTDYPIHRVLAAFELPLSDTFFVVNFCLKNTCRDDASYIYAGGGSTEPGVDFVVYEPEACYGCGYEPKTAALLTRSLDAGLDCAVPACDAFELHTACQCPGGPGGPQDSIPVVVGPGEGCFEMRQHHEAYRLNYGLPDNNNNRVADPAGMLDMGKVRRDRFLPGDTLRNILAAKIVCGDSIKGLFYQLFAEIIRSDFGYAGVFDTFNIGPNQTDAARNGFTDKDFISIAAATMTIWDSSAQAVYYCPLASIFPLDKRYGRVAVVNSKPASVIDELASMNYPFNPRMDLLSDSGYVPPGFLLESGDSVQLQIDLKLGVNYAPNCKQNFPPLINFEVGYNLNDLYRRHNYRRYDTLMFQYSGFADSLTKASFGIKPCEHSVQVTPFAYNIRIARENLFPFEVRPLSKISSYDLIMPPGLEPLSAELLFLNLQENVPVLQNIPLPFQTIPDSMLRIDFSPAYLSPPDEGYSLRTRVSFAPSCTFSEPDSSAQWVTLDFPGCMIKSDSLVYVLESKIGFFSNHAKDTLTTDELTLNFPTDSVSVDILLQNLAPVTAPNYWIQLLNPEGGLSGLTITAGGSSTAIAAVDGIYQLGNLPILGTNSLQINGVNTTCDPQQLRIIYGWDCQPHLQSGPASCAQDTLVLLFQPLNPEIELELKDFPVNVPLCDTSDYFILELSNADFGHAYEPVVNIELPAGLQLLSGSCQMAYPVDSAFIDIPDPIPAGNNLLEWNLAGLLEANSLPGAFQLTKNALQIRFKVIAACGVVSYAQLIFGARAEWSCGRPTNTLRKASDPILVEGLAPTYTLQVIIAEQGTAGLSPCATERTIAVTLFTTGPALSGDSIYALLPPGFSYVSGSYQPGVHAPAGQPALSPAGLRWPMPAGLSAGSVITFTFAVTTPAAPACEAAVLRMQARQQTVAYCPAIQADCKVYVITGENSYQFPPPAAGVALTGATLSIQPDGKVNYTVTVANSNALAPFEIDILQFFYDVNLNGKHDAGDELLYTVGDLNAILEPGGMLSIPLNGLPAPDSLCHLLVVLPTKLNCVCPVSAIPVSVNTVLFALLERCLGEPVPLGLPTAAGHSYAWSGVPGLPCTGCSAFAFEPMAAGLYQLTLADQGPSCLVTYHYDVQINDAPVLQPVEPAICRNETITLQTTPALSWNWQGPGISNPNAPVQILQPAQGATYFVTATNAAGCTLTDSLTVAVLPADTLDLGVLRTCQGTPVDIFGALTETPGLYSDIRPAITTGCDTLVYLRLEVVPNTEEAISKCVADTLLIFGKPVTEAGVYCETFESSLGCDSTHCIVLSTFMVPELPDPDTFYFVLGGSVQLPGPDGYASYLWAPAEYLSCTTCQSPFASPPDTMEYTLALRTGDGCKDTLIYRVAPFPPCDPARIRIPNVFTPDGDKVNDTFTVVPYEGVEVIARLTIYNRWGQKVYDASGPNAAWDGTTFGEPAPSDVYLWLLEVLCNGDERKYRRGDVTVLR